jgi:hypothetical protein
MSDKLREQDAPKVHDQWTVRLACDVDGREYVVNVYASNPEDASKQAKVECQRHFGIRTEHYTTVRVVLWTTFCKEG